MLLAVKGALSVWLLLPPVWVFVEDCEILLAVDPVVAWAAMVVVVRDVEDSELVLLDVDPEDLRE